MEVDKQTQDMLAVSASMRTALLVYSGITVKMMVDADLGAQLPTMFMVQYEPGGVAGAHDHPFEETYLILEGEVEAAFDGERYRLGPGDVAWAGVGCVHAFRNLGAGTVRWLETQAPQPPGTPLLPVRPGLGLPDGRRAARRREGTNAMDEHAVVVVGRDPAGSAGTSRGTTPTAGRRVVVTGRDADARRGGRRRDRRLGRGLALRPVRADDDRAGARGARLGRPARARRDRPRPEHRARTTTSRRRSGSSP